MLPLSLLTLFTTIIMCSLLLPQSLYALSLCLPRHMLSVCPGDLKTFLLARRQLVGQKTKEAEDVSPENLTRMALDIAYGLQYLRDLHYVHR